MSRVINTNSPAKIRNQNRRTIAELLRRLSQKGTMDAESRDMAAAIVGYLMEIHAGVLVTVEAWEKRGYWVKAERFTSEWVWAHECAANLDDVLRHEAWDLLPDLIMELFPHFNDIEIKTMTRKPIFWQDAYARLLAQPPVEAPW
jgi:hypothetical protein